MPNYKGLDPELWDRFSKANAEWKRQNGVGLPVTSGVRTRDEQQGLYNRRGEAGIYSPINPADYPNRTVFHTDALDISTSIPEDFLNRFGLHRPHGSKDPVHTMLMSDYKPVVNEKVIEKKDNSKQGVNMATKEPIDTASILKQTLAMIQQQGQPREVQLDPDLTNSLMENRQQRASALPMALGAMLSGDKGLQRVGGTMYKDYQSARDPMKLGNDAIMLPNGKVIQTGSDAKSMMAGMMLPFTIDKTIAQTNQANANANSVDSLIVPKINAIEAKITQAEERQRLADEKARQLAENPKGLDKAKQSLIDVDSAEKYVKAEVAKISQDQLKYAFNSSFDYSQAPIAVQRAFASTHPNGQKIIEAQMAVKKLIQASILGDARALAPVSTSDVEELKKNTVNFALDPKEGFQNWLDSYYSKLGTKREATLNAFPMLKDQMYEGGTSLPNNNSKVQENTSTKNQETKGEKLITRDLMNSYLSKHKGMSEDEALKYLESHGYKKGY